MDRILLLALLCGAVAIAAQETASTEPSYNVPAGSCGADCEQEYYEAHKHLDPWWWGKQ